MLILVGVKGLNRDAWNLYVKQTRTKSITLDHSTFIPPSRSVIFGVGFSISNL